MAETLCWIYRKCPLKKVFAQVYLAPTAAVKALLSNVSADFCHLTAKYLSTELISKFFLRSSAIKYLFIFQQIVRIYYVFRHVQLMRSQQRSRAVLLTLLQQSNCFFQRSLSEYGGKKMKNEFKIFFSKKFILISLVILIPVALLSWYSSMKVSDYSNQDVYAHFIEDISWQQRFLLQK